MKSLDATYRKFSSRGVDGASGLLGIGLGLTLALQVTTMKQSDISTVYAAVATFSRLCALTGTYFALVGWSMGEMRSGGWGGQSWLNTVSGSSIEMMRLRGPTGLIKGAKDLSV